MSVCVLPACSQVAVCLSVCMCAACMLPGGCTCACVCCLCAPRWLYTRTPRRALMWSLASVRERRLGLHQHPNGSRTLHKWCPLASLCSHVAQVVPACTSLFTCCTSGARLHLSVHMLHKWCPLAPLCSHVAQVVPACISLFTYVELCCAVVGTGEACKPCKQETPFHGQREAALPCHVGCIAMGGPRIL